MEMEAKRATRYMEFGPSMMQYWKGSTDGRECWFLYIPGCGVGNLLNHSVVENKDGTITVSPSILVTGHKNGEATQVHGYLENGNWRNC